MAWYSVEQLGDNATRNEHIVYVIVCDVASRYMALGPQPDVKFSTVLNALGRFRKIGCICVELSKPKRASIAAVVVKFPGIVRLKSLGQEVVLFGPVPFSCPGHNW